MSDGEEAEMAEPSAAFANLGGMAGALKKVLEARERLGEIQKKLKGKRVFASVGGGVVRVGADGTGEIVELILEREVVDPQEVEMLQDLIVAGVNQVREKAQELAQEEVRRLTGGLGLPPGWI